MARDIETKCCIAGGGPAGVMLGYLLARSGVEVVVLEKWPDFFRDFRGDTIHPSTMELLRELGLLDRFLALPHNETKQIAATINGARYIVADFSKLNTASPFLGFIPQWDFLTFISQEAQRYPGFRILMGTEAVDLIEADGKVVGVRAKDKDGEFDIRAPLVVGADGRHSTIREKSGLALIDLGAPIDVLWFRVSQSDRKNAESLGAIGPAGMLVAIDRDSYWQCAFVIRKGTFEAVKARGIESFRANVASLAPFLARNVHEINGWEDVKLLSVSVDHLDRWYRPGLLCIGDAAHAMSPIGGVGINLAVQDAVAAANILVPAFARAQGPALADLAAVEARRAFPARLIQRIQVFLHAHLLAPATEHGGSIRAPWILRLLSRVPPLRVIPARLVGIGFRPEHIQTRAMPH